MESIVNQQKIHFYEYFEVQVLHEYVRSGIFYLINTLVNSSDKLLTLRYYTSELTTLIDFLKDYYMLKVHQSTFAENFYQLQRQRQDGQPINAFKNALLWSMVPYIMQKIQSFYNKIKNQQQQGKQLSFPIKIFVICFPYLYAITSVLNVCMKYKYLMNQKALYYDLLYWICKVKTGYKQIQGQQYRYPLLQFFKSPGILCLLLGHKFLSWYYANNKKKRVIAEGQGKRVVSAPSLSLKQELKGDIDIKKGSCPICGQKISNPAFLRCSGYTFCYSCITQYVQGYQRCPMTRIKCNIDSIQVLYN